jgi:putative hydrolase of the HAD superfamily
MDKNIKNVVFDLGGVLLNLDLQRTIDAFKEAGFEDVEKQIRTFNHQGIFQQFEAGGITAEEFRNAIRENIQTALTDEEIDDYWSRMLLDIPCEKLKLILELREKYMVYLLSNTNPIHWNHVCKHAFDYHSFRVEDYFEETYLSYEMHDAKPNKSIFEKMLSEANLLPEETLFIDDSEANCQAAASLGIQVHHYRIGDDLKEIFE